MQVQSFSGEQQYAYRASFEDVSEEDRPPLIRISWLKYLNTLLLLLTSSSFQALPPPVEACLRFF